MKYVTAMLAFYALCTSCNKTSTIPIEHEQASDRLSQQELEEIRSYAEQFQFEELDETIVSPSKPSVFVQEAISRAGVVNEERHLPCAALFVLRMYHENMKRRPKSNHRTTPANSNVWLVAGGHSLEYEFARIAMPPRSKKDYYDVRSGYDWIKKHKSEFSDYPPIGAELDEIERLRENLERQQQEIAAEYDLKKLEDFAIHTPVFSNGRAPAAVPEEMNRVLEKLQAHQRTDHLPYLLEYGLNLYLKNLTFSHLARALPVDENLMLSELIRLTEIPKYKTAHEAGWLNNQFHGPFEETGHSSYQIYIWYLENWSSLSDMPNIERLGNIEEHIRETGMNGVGGGLVCHYGCR